MVPPGTFIKMVPPGILTSMVPPGTFIAMAWPGTGSVLSREIATGGGHGGCRGGQRPLASMAMVRGEGHIDGGPRADHHIGTVQAHHPVRDIGRGEKHRRG